MGLGKFVKKTINVVGTAAKVGVELGADAVGAIAEKIDDNPEKKEKYQNMGKKFGADIKASTSKFADESVDVVDNAVETSSKFCKDVSQDVKEKFNEIKTKNDSRNEATNVNYEEVKNENYGVINIKDEDFK